jgi:hypothetical protein
MRDRTWKVANILFGLLVLGIGVGPNMSPGRYGLFAFGAIAVLTVLNVFRLRNSGKLQAGSYLELIPPFLFLLGLFGALAAVSAAVVKIFAAAVGAILLYFYELGYPAKHPASFRDVFILSTGFLALLSIWSVNYFFTPTWWSVLLSTAAVFVLLFWGVFLHLGKDAARSLLYALLISFLLTEITWVVLYWPVHFLTAAATVFAGFYLLYMISTLQFSGRLSRSRVYFHLVLILFVLIFSLLTSSWQP